MIVIRARGDETCRTAAELISLNEDNHMCVYITSYDDYHYVHRICEGYNIETEDGKKAIESLGYNYKNVYDGK